MDKLNGFGIFLRNNWGKLIAGTVTILSAYFALVYAVKDHDKRLDKIETVELVAIKSELKQHDEFIIRQDEINKKLDAWLDRRNGRRP